MNVFQRCTDFTDMAMSAIPVDQINSAGEQSGDYMAGGKDPHRGGADRK